MANIRANNAKVKLKNNQVVTAISGILSSEIIDFLGPVGFDSVWIECEHGGVTWEQLGDMTRACDLWDMTPITRVNSNEPWLITRTLDRGSLGIVTPHINTSGDAQKAMQSSKYAPLGYRGMFGGRQSYGVPDYFHQANEQTMVIVLLEEAEALRNLESILKVDYIDVFFVAPSDLAQTMGHIGDPNHPEVQRAIEKAIELIVSSGRTAGTLVNDENASKYVDLGARFLLTSFNGWLSKGSTDFINKVSNRP